jgi:hypothetical protein
LVQLLINGPFGILGNAAFEVGRDGTPHIQSFVHLNQRFTRDQIAGFLGNGAHCEIAIGTDMQNFIYCCKDGNVFVLRPPDRDPDPNGATLLAAAQTLSTEEFIQSYPDAWLDHRASLRRIMLITAIAKARKWDGDLHVKNLWIRGKAC